MRKYGFKSATTVQKLSDYPDLQRLAGGKITRRGLFIKAVGLQLSLSADNSLARCVRPLKFRESIFACSRHRLGENCLRD
jgi:hypothetical protein